VGDSLWRGSLEETPAEAAARELEEESGYRARSLVPWMNCYASYGCSDQRFEIFWTSDAAETERGFDPAEVIEIRWFNRTELRELGSRQPRRGQFIALAIVAVSS